MLTQSESSWFPVFAGYGFIAVTVILLMLFPRTWWAQELLRTYGLRGTGPQGEHTRKDLLRGAGLLAALFLVLLFLAIVAGLFAERYPNLSTLNEVGLVYLFTCTILAGMALLGVVILLWRALWWKPAPNDA